MPGTFAVQLKGKRRPKVLACGSSRDVMLGSARALAAKRSGVELTGALSEGRWPPSLTLAPGQHMHVLSKRCGAPRYVSPRAVSPQWTRARRSRRQRRCWPWWPRQTSRCAPCNSHLACCTSPQRCAVGLERIEQERRRRRDWEKHRAKARWCARGVAQAAARLCEFPLAEWEVSRLRPRHDVQPMLAPLTAPHLQANPLAVSRDAKPTLTAVRRRHPKLLLLCLPAPPRLACFSGRSRVVRAAMLPQQSV